MWELRAGPPLHGAVQTAHLSPSGPGACSLPGGPGPGLRASVCHGLCPLVDLLPSLRLHGLGKCRVFDHRRQQILWELSFLLLGRLVRGGRGQWSTGTRWGRWPVVQRQPEPPISDLFHGAAEGKRTSPRVQLRAWTEARGSAGGCGSQREPAGWGKEAMCMPAAGCSALRRCLPSWAQQGLELRAVPWAGREELPAQLPLLGVWEGVRRSRGC